MNSFLSKWPKLTILVAIAMISFFIYSCKKELGKSDQPSISLEANQAKDWYTKVFPNDPSK